MTDDLRQRLGALERDFDTVKTDVANIRTAQAVHQVESATTRELVTEMRGDIKKLLWLIIGALVAAAVGFVVRGGLALPGAG